MLACLNLFLCDCNIFQLRIQIFEAVNLLLEQASQDLLTGQRFKQELEQRVKLPDPQLLSLVLGLQTKECDSCNRINVTAVIA